MVPEQRSCGQGGTGPFTERGDQLQLMTRGERGRVFLPGKWRLTASWRGTSWNAAWLPSLLPQTLYSLMRIHPHLATQYLPQECSLMSVEEQTYSLCCLKELKWRWEAVDINRLHHKMCVCVCSDFWMRTRFHFRQGRRIQGWQSGGLVFQRVGFISAGALHIAVWLRLPQTLTQMKTQSFTGLMLPK